MPESVLTAEQQALREGRYTSSRIVALYQGRFWQVYNDLIGVGAEIPDNRRMLAGRKLQSPIIEWAAEERGWTGLALAPPTIVSRSEPLFASSPDALVWDTKGQLVVEAKNRAGARTSEYEEGPLETDLVQLQWHMGVSGIHRGAVVVLLGGNDLRHGGNDPRFDAEFDPEMFTMLSDLALRFQRERVEPRIPPTMDASDAASAYIKATWPKEKTPLLVDDGRFAPLAEALRAAKTEREAAAEREKLAAHELQAALGDAEGVEGPFGKILWRWQKGSTYTATRKPTRVLRPYFREE